MPIYAIGDIHGRLTAFEQCLERCAFDFENDDLICLGDVADRGAKTFECFELLLQIKNLTYIIGNHDKWFLDWLNDPEKTNQHWLNQGGMATFLSYIENLGDEMKKHYKLLRDAHLYFTDYKNRLYVHGGFDLENCLENTASTNPEIFYWDRNLWKTAQQSGEKIEFQLNKESPVCYNDIFIGHSNTFLSHPDLKPVRCQNVWNLDQGAGHGGKLTIMDVDTYAYWQSDKISK